MSILVLAHSDTSTATRVRTIEEKNIQALFPIAKSNILATVGEKLFSTATGAASILHDMQRAGIDYINIRVSSKSLASLERQLSGNTETVTAYINPDLVKAVAHKRTWGWTSRTQSILEFEDGRKLVAQEPYKTVKDNVASHKKIGLLCCES